MHESAQYRVIDFGTHIAVHEVYFASDGTITGRSQKPWSFEAPVEDGVAYIVEELEDALETIRAEPALIAVDHPGLSAVTSEQAEA